MNGMKEMNEIGRRSIKSCHENRLTSMQFCVRQFSQNLSRIHRFIINFGAFWLHSYRGNIIYHFHWDVFYTFLFIQSVRTHTQAPIPAK